MTVKLDFEDCLKDSPRFRAAIDVIESEVTELETKLEKMVKVCSTMLDTGRIYNQSSKQFVSGIRELSQHSSGDNMMMECLEKFSDCLSNMIEAHMELLDTTQRAVKQQVQNLVKEDIRKFKDVKKEFDKGSEALESALLRNAQAPRNKQHEVEDSSSALLAARKSFRNEALDYVLQINIIQGKKKYDILQAMLNLMDGQATYFTQGYDGLKELQTYRKELAAKLHQLVLNAAREARDMEQRHATIKKKDISYDDSIMECKMDAPSGIVMEGYLFKRASNAFKTWSRRWFSIQNNQLVYQKKIKDNVTVVVEDLRLCTVKPCPENERRFCFEVVSPSKACMLQADSEKQQQAWVVAVQNSIASAFSESREDTLSSKSDRTSFTSTGSFDLPGSGKEVIDKKVLDQVQRIPGNAQCCDCNEPAPEWASINLGISLCIECSGIHRSLGVHFSKVRSLTLDSWEPELIKLMCELGNATINRIYEARIEEMTRKKPSPSSTRQDKEAWIRAKYVEKKFIKKLPDSGSRLHRSSLRHHRSANPERTFKPEKPPKPVIKPKPLTLPRTAAPGNMSAFAMSSSSSSSNLHSSGSVGDMHENDVEDDREDMKHLHPGALLYRAAVHQSLPIMADALAHGADVNWVNAAEENRTPLIQAVSSNSLVACEFLLQNGASVNLADSYGRGPLHHATILGHTGLACLFLKRGANQNATDMDDKDPLTIAIENANADIVTLLRLAKMREAEVAMGQSGDETYQDIFRDFSLMASDNPEKLDRRSYTLKLTTM
ncbi:arf-GAP with coiled-coil, ANK repeat and PH domain-containing protein 1 [Protopterus annectens]|uniref:arf-GAP with coiled-coil, ANK repeat and PH domain-containing protein 1 n=1 Tax=Protopterus annectens TaxID=7888 RepID=UPI001CFB0A8F|nr:arf-GAP with coiled-coil, ANK repeat and PH domain-containing protein 1 [Protopterus annectens]